MTEAGFITPPDLPLPQGEGVTRGCRRWRLYAGNKGVTLVELMVVIGVVGILSAALGFFYIGWQGAYNVEKATNGIFSDMIDARARAMQFNRNHFIGFPAAAPTTYRVIDDVNENNAADDAPLATFPKTLGYTISNDAGGAGTITFDKRGLISATAMTAANPAVVVCLTTTSNPDYDCIEISQTRVLMGKLATQISNGGACNAANCVPK